MNDISHELRTPVTIAQGHLELLAAARSRSAIVIALDELGRIERIIARLLLLAKTGHATFLAPTEIDVEQFVEDIFVRWSEVAPRSWRLGPTFKGRSGRTKRSLRAAMDALVENAVKFTDVGDPVELRARSLDFGLVIDVIDGGPGIDPDKTERIFERFGRGDDARTRTAGGVGLGLAIVQAVAQVHGGSCRVASRPGHTVFSLRYSRTSSSSTSSRPRSSMSRRRSSTRAPGARSRGACALALVLVCRRARRSAGAEAIHGSPPRPQELSLCGAVAGSRRARSITRPSPPMTSRSRMTFTRMTYVVGMHTPWPSGIGKRCARGWGADLNACEMDLRCRLAGWGAWHLGRRRSGAVPAGPVVNGAAGRRARRLVGRRGSDCTGLRVARAGRTTSFSRVSAWPHRDRDVHRPALPQLLAPSRRTSSTSRSPSSRLPNGRRSSRSASIGGETVVPTSPTTASDGVSARSGAGRSAALGPRVGLARVRDRSPRDH